MGVRSVIFCTSTTFELMTRAATVTPLVQSLKPRTVLMMGADFAIVSDASRVAWSTASAIVAIKPSRVECLQQYGTDRAGRACSYGNVAQTHSPALCYRSAPSNRQTQTLA